MYLLVHLCVYIYILKLSCRVSALWLTPSAPDHASAASWRSVAICFRFCLCWSSNSSRWKSRVRFEMSNQNKPSKITLINELSLLGGTVCIPWIKRHLYCYSPAGKMEKPSQIQRKGEVFTDRFWEMFTRNGNLSLELHELNALAAPRHDRRSSDSPEKETEWKVQGETVGRTSLACHPSAWFLELNGRCANSSLWSDHKVTSISVASILHAGISLASLETCTIQTGHYSNWLCPTMLSSNYKYQSISYIMNH